MKRAARVFFGAASAATIAAIAPGCVIPDDLAKPRGLLAGGGASGDGGADGGALGSGDEALGPGSPTRLSCVGADPAGTAHGALQCCYLADVEQAACDAIVPDWSERVPRWSYDIGSGYVPSYFSAWAVSWGECLNPGSGPRDWTIEVKFRPFSFNGPADDESSASIDCSRSYCGGKPGAGEVEGDIRCCYRPDLPGGPAVCEATGIEALYQAPLWQWRIASAEDEASPQRSAERRLRVAGCADPGDEPSDTLHVELRVFKNNKVEPKIATASVPCRASAPPR